MKKMIMVACCMVIALANCANAQNEQQACQPPPATDKTEGDGNTAQSCDPNEISGPLGMGEKRYVAQGEWVNYTIYFENKTNATAAAQEVFVDLPMDENLDWSTLELGEIAFGDHIDTSLSGKSHGKASYAMPGTNTFVKTEVKMKDGVLSWYMRDWDPTTADNFPASATGGFLPPNDPETHCGEGHLSYRVRVKSDAPNGAVIRASAQIVFDSNPMIETDPSWWNTVATFYNVSLEIDGVTTNLTLIVGEPYGELPTPKARSGYTFGGWYTGPNGTGRRITAQSLVEAGDSKLYANWKAIAGGSDGGGSGGGVTPMPVVAYGGILKDVAFSKAQTVMGALYKDDALAGTVELKFGKINTKKGIVKVSGTATLMDGGKSKKVSAKAVNMSLAGGAMSGTLAFKAPVGSMAFTLSSDGKFTLKNSSYEMVAADVGGTLSSGRHTFTLGEITFASGGDLQEQLLPMDETFSVSGGKWTFGKNASVKWARDRSTKEYALLVDTAKGKTNLSSLKLTYTPKTGLFKGSFKVYALTVSNGRTKLAKYTANVIGFVVDGVGYGQATIKRPAAGPWSVTVK